MKTKTNAGKFFLGTLLGGMIGGITALLIAPQSGEETQKIIIEKKDELQHEAEKRLVEGRSVAEEKFVETRNLVADWLSTGSNLLDEKSKEIKIETTKKAKKANSKQVSA